MKTSSLLHGEISQVIARTGHTQSITIADAGLPIPLDQHCIDLALTAGIPSFIDVVTAVCSEYSIERAVIAEEMQHKNPHIYTELTQLLKQIGEQQCREIILETCPHEAFKASSNKSNAVIRSGECSPYANIILYAGVTF
ncbi:D-ribose pyranase [Cardiobacteriaceae bacterium TAE3-ERU3]|nr:D-ribose pyranase [Cardiobacteriaceae bacterium TAE3-ERU3]